MKASEAYSKGLFNYAWIEIKDNVTTITLTGVKLKKPIKFKVRNFGTEGQKTLEDQDDAVSVTV